MYIYYFHQKKVKTENIQYYPMDLVELALLTLHLNYSLFS